MSPGGSYAWVCPTLILSLHPRCDSDPMIVLRAQVVVDVAGIAVTMFVANAVLGVVD